MTLILPPENWSTSAMNLNYHSSSHPVLQYHFKQQHHPQQQQHPHNHHQIIPSPQFTSTPGYAASASASPSSTVFSSDLHLPQVPNLTSTASLQSGSPASNLSSPALLKYDVSSGDPYSNAPTSQMRQTQRHFQPRQAYQQGGPGQEEQQQQQQPLRRTQTREGSSARRRTSRAGTRSVSTLNAAQLERKRANDREAQRAIRQRTKEQIESLEKKVAELSKYEGLRDELVGAQQRNKELEEENLVLKTKLSRALHSLNRSSSVGT